MSSVIYSITLGFLKILSLTVYNLSCMEKNIFLRVLDLRNFTALGE